MKKKVLSVALASALFVGAAASASAVVWGPWDNSSKSGENSDITALAFTEKSYTIRNGAGAKDMLEVITAYAGDKAIVQEPDLEWEISENDLVFELNTEDNGATVAAYENSGSATITVTANDGKVKASCKVVAAPLVKATGFKFEKTTYTLPSGEYAVNQGIKIVPTPSSAYFSDEQVDTLKKAVVDLVASKTIKDKENVEKYAEGDIIARAEYTDGDADREGVVLTFIGQTPEVQPQAAGVVIEPSLEETFSNVTSARLVLKDLSNTDDNTKVWFPAYDPDKTGKYVSRDVRASTNIAKKATRAGRTGAITIEVGQSVKLGDYVKFGPTDANVGKDLNTWSIDYYNAASTDDDYAVLNDEAKKVLGVAVGRVKAVTTFNAPDGKTIEIEVPINVVARGASSKPETPVATTESATLAIGGTYWAESGNENTEWTVDNDNVTIVPEKGAGCKIFAKKAGTATVTGTVDGEVVKTVNVTITAAGATTPDVPSEANPSTGDSLLAFLF